MRSLKLFGLFAIFALTLAGCGPVADVDTSEDVEVGDTTTTEVEVEIEAEEDAIADAEDYYGTWEKVATYANGDLFDESEAMLTLEDGAFTSVSGDCTNSGTLFVEGALMTMTITEHNCDIVAGFETIEYEYELVDDMLVLTSDDLGFELVAEYSTVK